MDRNKEIVPELKRASITDSDTTKVRGNPVGAADRYEIRNTGGHERQPGLLSWTQKRVTGISGLIVYQIQNIRAIAFPG
jgi:hypothetical protein